MEQLNGRSNAKKSVLIQTKADIRHSRNALHAAATTNDAALDLESPKSMGSSSISPKTDKIRLIPMSINVVKKFQIVDGQDKTNQNIRKTLPLKKFKKNSKRSISQLTNYTKLHIKTPEYCGIGPVLHFLMKSHGPVVSSCKNATNQYKKHEKAMFNLPVITPVAKKVEDKCSEVIALTRAKPKKLIPSLFSTRRNAKTLQSVKLPDSPVASQPRTPRFAALNTTEDFSKLTSKSVTKYYHSRGRTIERGVLNAALNKAIRLPFSVKRTNTRKVFNQTTYLDNVLVVTDNENKSNEREIHKMSRYQRLKAKIKDLDRGGQIVDQQTQTIHKKAVDATGSPKNSPCKLYNKNINQQLLLLVVQRVKILLWWMPNLLHVQYLSLYILQKVVGYSFSFVIFPVICQEFSQSSPLSIFIYLVVLVPQRVDTKV
eukprot:TRINITY_DN70842_c0_g1_i1.p2 TRINITY_DN70842_c0_g1~~TRINITY_DN70842_c0_g1_i1.p2  ORF type:complete len:429 (+),score=6.30 TRINITY_DN70842_c0_g1_i1:116-1402(+)